MGCTSKSSIRRLGGGASVRMQRINAAAPQPNNMSGCWVALRSGKAAFIIVLARSTQPTKTLLISRKKSLTIPAPNKTVINHLSVGWVEGHLYECSASTLLPRNPTISRLLGCASLWKGGVHNLLAPPNLRKRSYFAKKSLTVPAPNKTVINHLSVGWVEGHLYECSASTLLPRNPTICQAVGLRFALERQRS